MLGNLPGTSKAQVTIPCGIPSVKYSLGFMISLINASYRGISNTFPTVLIFRYEDTCNFLHFFLWFWGKSLYAFPGKMLRL
ncbi:hypothetical protein B6U74_03895 [Candidatus Bathyarchaeota archaeon ex4484_205]|nr:MAG: hypothetical protein B6U74_03895 [Candidatus Bathyarchaeota archaeon ex4484_205]RLG68070.1 MAG: hypothetical protein DRN93_03400 [archaeon]